jgi:hypothetical protein
MSLPVVIVHGRRKVLGYQQITDLDSAVNLSPGSATLALIQAETKSVRWRDDGVAPDVNTGMLLATGSVMEYDGNLSAIQFIETDASATLNISYYGPEQV